VGAREAEGVGVHLGAGAVAGVGVVGEAGGGQLLLEAEVGRGAGGEAAGEVDGAAHTASADVGEAGVRAFVAGRTEGAARRAGRDRTDAVAVEATQVGAGGQVDAGHR